MGTTLTGTTPQDTYDSLIKVTDNGPLSATGKYLSDGLGNDSVLALSTTAVGVGLSSPASGRLQVRGSGVTSGTNALFVDNSVGAATFAIRDNGDAFLLGNVGIGTSTPLAKLNVADAALTTLALTATGEATDQKNWVYQYGAAVGAGTFRLRASNDAVSDGQNAVIITRTGFNVDTHRFLTSGSERFRITDNGVTFNGDTAAANALDDYEEGTWTMGISFGGGTTGITYDASTLATYTKIGRQVTVNGFVALTNKGSSTGSARITGLPFTIANSSAYYSAAAMRFQAINFVGQFQAYGTINSTTILLQQTTTLGVNTDITNTEFSNSSQIMISFTYFV